MDKFIPLSFTFIVFIFMAFKLWMRSKLKDSPINLLPAPWKLPIIGHMHLLLFSLPHRRLMELAKRHGSIRHLQLGELPHVVVSSPESAKEVLKTHDINFANRPFLLAAEIILYNTSDIGFSLYGGYWRQLRKACTLELLSTKRVQSFRSIREEQVSSFIRSIFPNTGLEINLGEMLCNLSYNITLRTAFSGRCKQHEAFISYVKLFVESLAGFSISDLFPSIKWLPMITGMRAKLERFHRDLDTMLDDIIEEHRSSTGISKNSDDETDDLLDILLKLQDHGGLEAPLTTDNVKAVILNCFSGHADGWNRDIFNFRRMGNVGRDPNFWNDAERFHPERFNDGVVDYKGTNFEYIPFGAGRRMCPGMSYGLAVAELSLAQLLYHFDWKLPNGMKEEDLDMTESFGITVRRKKDLYLIPIQY